MRPIVIATNGVSTSNLARLDEYANAPVSIQCTVSGTATYTVQTSNDDPNSVTNPVPLASMTWLSSLDTNAVNATTSISTFLQYPPLFVRINQSSGTGSVTATVVQMGVAPY
jgi:hypothetical protein